MFSTWWNSAVLRVKALFKRRNFDRDLEEEMAFHLAMSAERHPPSAMDDQANSSTLKSFGNPTLIREQCREMRTFNLPETLWQDLRYGARLLCHGPVFTAVAIITLALGIGANTAIFSITSQVLLQLLPVPHPEQLVVLRSPGLRQGHVSSDGDDAASFSYPVYRRIRERTNHVFTGVLARQSIGLSVSGLGTTERAAGELVSGNYFETLEVTPALGRVFSEEDETAPGANPVAILSYGYWTRHFGKDPSVLNKQLNVNGSPLTVVGVSREGFTGIEVGELPDIFIPISMAQQMSPNADPLESTRYHWLAVLARLRPGVSRRSAEATLPAVFRPILEEDMPLEQVPPRSKEQFLARKLLLEDGSHGRLVVQQDARTPLIMLTSMVGLVLIIACANLAGLLIARGEARQREIAVRLSLGATRRRVLRQLLTEGLLLALGGAAVGLAISPLLIRGIVLNIPRSAGLNGLHTDLDLRLLFFSLGLALVTTLLFALVPALRLLRVNTQAHLKEQSAGSSTGTSAAALRKWLIVIQVVFTTILLVAAGLFTRSLMNIHFLNLGLNPDHLVEFSVAPELNHYSPPQTLALIERLRTAIAALPGVHSVSAAEITLLSDSDHRSNITIEGVPPSDSEDPTVDRNDVGPNYFSTMDIPLVSGREFRETDTLTSPKVAIINQKLAERYFPGRDPLGKHLHFGRSNAAPDIEIIGVVKDSKHSNPRDPITPFAYTPYAQDPKLGHVTFYVRSSQDPASLANSLRAAVSTVDGSLPVYQLMTVNERRDEAAFAEKLMAVLCLVMGILAALLAALGLYGVMAYTVARRIREIGIRMALGATRSGVAWLVLQDIVRVTLIGLVVGLSLAVVIGHLIQAQLFGVKATNPLILLLTSLLLCLVAALAGIVPARRAASVQPMVALRYE